MMVGGELLGEAAGVPAAFFCAGDISVARNGAKY
jgi:hypothetical protein